MFGIGASAGRLRRGPGIGGVVGGGRPMLPGQSTGGGAAAIAGRMRGGAAPSAPMSGAVPSTGLGASSDMKPPDTRDASETRTFTSGPYQTMGGHEFRGQGSSLRSATRRNGRRAGRALSR